MANQATGRPAVKAAPSISCSAAGLAPFSSWALGRCSAPGLVLRNVSSSAMLGDESPVASTSSGDSTPAAASRAGWPSVGSVCAATVKEINAKGALLILADSGLQVTLLHTAITGGKVPSKTDPGKLAFARAQDVLKEGETIKVLVTGHGHDRFYVSTKPLEAEPGQMLRDKEAVFAGAEQAAATWKAVGAEKSARRQALVARMQVGDVMTATMQGVYQESVYLEIEGSIFTARRKDGFGRNRSPAKGALLQVRVRAKQAGGTPSFSVVGGASEAKADGAVTVPAP